ncbi:membrane protein insertion efficiency factor YidD [Pseudomonas eucalypticola]|uniref:Membrane protein insertion efficiency factor YidD n=2 Tax=Pseudomonas TaxID=286 RepID=A0A7D5D7J7_9PSED|nr:MULTISPECIES: membrane protein insertion efficiency factor YidD [Pseudomonas]QKZ04880.1 membrane protein insertion efficiency factor YidD [Pseudomonas eucalypticola]
MITWLSVSAIRAYQRVAPARLRNACRFEPSCSRYAVLAIEKHGAVRGWTMALKRIHRCRVPHGGIDYP